MKFIKLFSLFAFLSLAVLALGVASAQTTPCLILQSSSFPNSAINTQGSFTASFVLNNTGIGCTAARNITLINFNSILGSNNVSSSWNLTQTLPITIAVGQLSSFTAIFSIPSGASGNLSNSISVSATTQVGSPDPNSPYTFQLPSITITSPPTTNLTLSVTGTQPFSINQNATLTLTNTGNTNLSNIRVSEAGNSTFGVIFSPSAAISNLTAGAQSTITAVLNSLTNLRFGINTINIQAVSDSSSQIATSTFQVKKTFCSAGEVLSGNLTIDEINWENNGEGTNENWELLDEIEVEVTIRNNNRDDNIDAVVELGLFDRSGNNVADDLDFVEGSDSTDEEIEIRIDDDSDETVKWIFKVPADFDTGSYKLAVKVYDEDVGEVRSCRDSSSDFTGSSFFEEISIKRTSDDGKFVVVDDITMDSQLSCSQIASGQFTVFNVGKDDQDRVKITIRNRDLGISEIREIIKDLDQGDDETLGFTLQIPATARNGNYVLEFITEYDYKNGVYRQESDDTFDFPFEVIGCSQNLGTGSGGLTDIEINAELASEAKAGKELIVKATIKNTGDEDADYSLSARGYSTWAELIGISDIAISVDAGESEEVTFTLLVNEDASGPQVFDIQVASGGKVMIQEVEVEISSGSGKFLDAGNVWLWVIAAVNLILIILIIVVAVKLSRK